LTGIKEKTPFVRPGLEALIAHESSKRIAKPGGTEKTLHMPPGVDQQNYNYGSC
jgi:hypothetical protein